MKNRRFALGVTAAAVLLLAGLAAELFLPALMGSGDPHAEVPEEFAQQITVHENKDFVYSYTLSDVTLDEETLALYVPNLVNVFTERPLSRKEKKKLAEQVEGTVVTDICGCINLIQLYVPGESLAQVEAAAEQAMQAEGVSYAGYEVPLLVEENAPDENPWQEDGVEQDRGNEESPGGTDWWAEAIGAYTAWNYEQWCHDVTVGIVDAGFYFLHEDLTGNTTVRILPGYEENTINYHGTAVAGIIGAADNDIGLRGVASSRCHQLTMYCADWSPVTNFEGARDYVNMLVTGEYTEAIKGMVEQGAKVINNSWGFTKYSDFEEIVQQRQYIWNEQPMDMWSVYGSYEACVRQTAIHAMNMLASLLAAKEDVLIVQSAGNGLNNGERPLSTDESCGVFGFITPELFREFYGDAYKGEISYEELYSHILIVGAIQNQRAEDGAYILTSWSNFGPAVDLCAPGDQIFTTTDSTGREEDGSRYTKQFGGTSAAAPMVTGAATLLWSIEPDLSAAKVKDLLIQNTRDQAVGTRDAGQDEAGSTGRYPVLNVGAAVEALIAEKNEALVAELLITDKQTGEPVEGAEVIYCHGFFDAVQSVVTDGEGDCSFRGADDLRPYPAETTVLVKAEGQLRWCGTVRAWLEDDPDQTVNEIELDLNNILDVTGDLLNQLKEDLPALWEYVETIMDQVEPAEADFSDTLAQLTGQYGVISLGKEVYPEVTGYGGGEELVDPARLTGLLEADIFDYDGDGQEELLTVRLETEAGSDEGWGETQCFLTVYEWNGAAEQAVPVGEKSFRFNALTNSLTQSAIHLARGTFDNGETGLYLTYSWEMNDCVFGVLRISYQGALEVTGGVECHDFHGAFYCYDAVGSGAMDALCQSGFVDSDGWMPLEAYEFEGSDPDQSRIEQYRACYMEELEDIGLIEPGLPGQWMNPDRPTGNDLETIIQAAQFDRASIVRKPADRYIVSNGQLTNLCGLWHLSSTALLEEDMTLSVYDEGDLLTPWR